MTENIEIAFQLLIVGMLSVFIILGIVTGLARMLISLVNRFGPASPGKEMPSVKSSVNARHIAAITATVNLVTKGKGIIQSIKKI